VLVQVTSCCMTVLNVALMLLALLQKIWCNYSKELLVVAALVASSLSSLYQYKYPHLNIEGICWWNFSRIWLLCGTYS